MKRRLTIWSPFASVCSGLAVLATVASAADLQVPTEEYPTIQAAVDAAHSGDTIHIAAGVYLEQVTVTRKNLNLIGRPGATLRASPNMDPGGGGETQWRPILFVFECPEVLLRDLAFEGDQLADQQQRGLAGAAYFDSGGTVESCRFTGFRERVAGSNEGAAILFLNDLLGASLLSVRVAGNIIEDSYVGIVLEGAPDRISYDFTIENNTIRGVGPTSTTAEPSRRGINLKNGITGSVMGNHISGFSYDGEGAEYPFAWGIIAIGTADRLSNVPPLAPMRFENNYFEDNNQHLMLVRANNHEIVNNHFEGTGPGQRPAGVWFTGENVQVRGNVFCGMEEGIRVGGVDPEYGTDLGIAVNAQLVDNRFCEVAVTAAIQPQATASEKGSLICPFPEPELIIESAVLLSWPEIEEGFVVESAPGPDGPWTSLDGTHFLQNGNHSLAVPTDSEHRLFRLHKE